MMILVIEIGCSWFSLYKGVFFGSGVILVYFYEVGIVWW